MLDGTIAANDWAISNVKATAQSKAFHVQLLKITQDMTGLAIPTGTTNEALQEMQTTFLETKDAGLVMAKMMTDNLTPAFERISSLIQSKDMKELRDNLKKMELPPGFKHGLDDAIKPLRGAAEEARQLGNAMDILVTAGENMSKKDLAKNMKAFGKELDRISKIKGTSAPVDAILMSLKTMSPEELGLHSKSMDFLAKTLDKYGKLPKDKAQEFLQMFKDEVPTAGSNAATAPKGINTLADSLLRIAEANFDPSKFIPSTKAKNTFKNPTLSASGGTQKTTVALDTGPANAALSALIKRIDTISNMKPAFQLITTSAHSVLSALIKRIDSLSNMKPAPQLNTKPANSALSALIKRIDSISNMKPAPQLNTKPANNALSALIKRIDSISKMKPSLNLNTKPAQNAISGVINRIDSISKMHPSVTVKVNYDTSAKPTGIKADSGSSSKFDSGAGVTLSKTNSGTGTTGGNLIVNNIIDLGGDKFIRSVKRKLGNNVYTLGA